MLLSLIYVSHSRLAIPAQAGEIERIVAGAIERNADLDIRGALIFTERHFAQLLEGPEPAVERLMERIRADWRHDRVTVIERRPIGAYRFADWSLAYWGDAIYMDRQVARVLHKAEHAACPDGASDLYALLHLLARESRRQNAPIGRPSPR